MQRMLLGRAALLAAVGFATFGCSPPAGSDAGDVQRTDAVDRVVPVTDVTSQPDTVTPVMNCGSVYAGCNPVTNTPCGAGQACVTTAAMMGTCMAAGTAAFGAPCMASTDCREGMICLADGTCHLLCCGADDVERCRDEAVGGRPGARCDTGIRDTPLFACSLPERCDWIAQDCAGGNNCIVVDAAGNSRCVMPGMVAAGGTCTSANDCMRGFACIGPPMGTSTCAQICNPRPEDGGTSPACPAGQTCMGLTGAPPTFGACQSSMM